MDHTNFCNLKRGGYLASAVTFRQHSDRINDQFSCYDDVVVATQENYIAHNIAIALDIAVDTAPNIEIVALSSGAASSEVAPFCFPAPSTPQF
jgi:hypothetical protein